MLGFAAAFVACITAACAVAPQNEVPSAAVTRVVNLTRTSAFEELRDTNPRHFEIIRDIIAGLLEEPARAERDWLRVNFDVTDVDLGRLVMMTSYPPRQHLSFTLEDVRYHLYLTRSDLLPGARPSR